MLIYWNITLLMQQSWANYTEQCDKSYVVARNLSPELFVTVNIFGKPFFSFKSLYVILRDSEGKKVMLGCEHFQAFISYLQMVYGMMSIVKMHLPLYVNKCTQNQPLTPGHLLLPHQATAPVTGTSLITVVTSFMVRISMIVKLGTMLRKTAKLKEQTWPSFMIERFSVSYQCQKDRL